MNYSNKLIAGVLKYGFYEQELFHKERKELWRTLRRIFKRHFKIDVKDSKIKISSDYWEDGVKNWRNPTVKLVYKQHVLTITSEELETIYYHAYSNKFSGRFHPLVFFEYVRNRNKSADEKDLERRRKRKKIVDGKCENCGNEESDRMESFIVKGRPYFKCTACQAGIFRL